MSAPEPGRVTRALLAIPPAVHGDRALAERICLACVAGLDVDGAAISLLTASTLRHTLFASDATADLLEDLQFTLGEGACMDAARGGRVVLVPDMDDATQVDRWPAYAAAVVDQAGVRAVFAFPLQWATINLGVLDLYRRSPGPLAPAQLQDATDAVAAAALLLLGLRSDPGDGQGWDRSWGQRAEIHQATGMVVAQLEISASDAFARLRAHAFAQRRLLGDVARDVVGRRLVLTQDAGGRDAPRR